MSDEREVEATLNRDGSRIMCGVHGCPGVVGNLLYWNEDFNAIEMLPGYCLQQETWRPSNGARIRLGKAAPLPSHHSAKHAKRYEPGSPAQQFGYHQAPPKLILRSASDIASWVSWAISQQTPEHTIGHIWEDPKPITEYRAQDRLPCRIECRRCHRINMVPAKILDHPGIARL